MDIEYLLTATRSARKTLELATPVDLDVIHECLGIGLQAANGSHQRAWRWIVVTDPRLRARTGQWYRETYLSKVGGRFIADLMPGGTPESRLMSSTEWLAEFSAGAPHPRIRDLHHHPAPASRTRGGRTARHPRVGTSRVACFRSARCARDTGSPPRHADRSPTSSGTTDGRADEHG